MSSLSRRIARSRAASVAALPQRIRDVAMFDGHLIKESAGWLFRSREHTNYTYDLTALNREHLAWWLSNISGEAVGVVRSYIDELLADTELVEHIQNATRRSVRWRLADSEVRYGRRVGWYALVRLLRPAHVIESGTDKGLGSCVIAAAIRRNGHGHLTTVDLNPDSGYLIGGYYGDVTTRVIGESVKFLEGCTASVDLFLHDSLHTFEHEMAEFSAVAPSLARCGVVMSDYAHASFALPRWAESRGFRFAFFREEPSGHWAPGEGIGIAWNAEYGPDGVR